MGSDTPTLHTVTLRRVLLVTVGWLVFAAPAQAGTLPGPAALTSAAPVSVATTVAATVATVQTSVTNVPQDIQNVPASLPDPVRAPAQAVVAAIPAVPATAQTVVRAAVAAVPATPVVRQAAKTVETSAARPSHPSHFTRHVVRPSHAKRLHARTAAAAPIHRVVARAQTARAIPSRSPADDLFGASSAAVFATGGAHVAASLPPASHLLPLERARRAAHPVDGAPRPAALPLQLERPG
jgi:hypothetical protein